jgi:large-conductance mechanosensitive channel
MNKETNSYNLFQNNNMQNNNMQNNNMQNNNMQNNNYTKQSQKTILENIKALLDTKTGTIFASAIGMTIAIAFNEFIRSFVLNILQPMIIQIFYMTRLNNYFDFATLISEKNNALNLTNFTSSIVTFIFILFTVYYLKTYASI